MKITVRQYAIALYESLQEVMPQDQEQVLNNFVKLLAEAGQLAEWERIESEFLAHEQKVTGRITAELTFARQQSVERKVIDELNRIIGQHVEIRKKVDAKIIGGVIIQTEDQRIDASAKRQLDNLKKSLTG